MNESLRDACVALTARFIQLLDKGDHWIHGRLASFLSDVPILNHLTADTQISSRGILLAVTGFVLLITIVPVTEWSLRRMGFQETNFRGQTIPQSFGLAILIWLAVMLPLDGILLSRGLPERFQWLECIMGFGILGLLDDVRGDKKIKGFRGHFRVLFAEARVTTGLIKALGGLCLSAWLAVQLHEAFLWQTAVSALVIALSANALNLFDLRPGRACAVFCAAATCLLCFYFYHDGGISVPSLLYVLIPTVAVWAKDARAQAMLGDTGSNLLGGALGLGFCIYCSALAQVVICIGLILLTILAERFSITALIERNRLLRTLDGLTGERNPGPNEK